MMKWIPSLLFLLFVGEVSAQKYVDTLYHITTEENISYGEAPNFAGVNTPLSMDISYPTNDTVGTCGRPLAIIIHGGAFAAGSKDDNTIVRLRKDFAKRGYVAVAINYRLGYFQSHVSKNCNISNWNCLNLADSSEWIRAWYRGVQDAKGALRHMINNTAEYSIDPSNVFVFGESAGAFISYGVGFLDFWEEKPVDCYALSAVLPPHSNYYSPCIQNASYSIPIANMNLSRPDLGSIEGTLNPTNQPYIIKGIGSLFGGLFTNLFEQTNFIQAPKVYLFHQPNDLIVPFQAAKVFAGYNSCAMATGCVAIQDRPLVYGGQGVVNLINDLVLPPHLTPPFLLESTNNTSDCLGQALNPATGGHQYDSFWTRTRNMAAYFALDIEANDCETLLQTNNARSLVRIFPNPSSGQLNIEHPFNQATVTIVSLQGQVLTRMNAFETGQSLDLTSFDNGVYILILESSQGTSTHRILLTR